MRTLGGVKSGGDRSRCGRRVLAVLASVAFSVATSAGEAVAAEPERPDEDALFGSPSSASSPSPSAAPAAASDENAKASSNAESGRERDEDAMFGGGDEPARAVPRRDASAGSPKTPREERDDATELVPSRPGDTAFNRGDVRDDPLKIGGQFYLRAIGRARDPGPPRNYPFTAPILLDGYLDGRPNEHVRGMLVTRLTYDPTNNASGGQFSGLGIQSTQQRNPRLDIDQLWLRTDVLDTVFVTAGKQHVRWGTSRFWNPTDYLSAQRRDPLAVFDARLGVNMVKFHVPVESKGWNFYALGLLDNYQAANEFGKLGAAARAEFVFGTAEIGFDAVLNQNVRPRYGVDLSAGIGPFDVYSEIALRRGADAPVWRRRSGVSLPSTTQDFFGAASADAFFEQYNPKGLNASATGGLTYQFNYSESDTAIVGVEYFYNRFGYNDPTVLFALLSSGSYRPFYSARHYGAVYASLPQPGSWENTTFTFSNLMSISDPTAIARIDFSWRAHSYLTFEAYVQGHYGKTGEFRLGFQIPGGTNNGNTPQDPSDDTVTPATTVPFPVAEAGVGLRMAL